jgi:hypothetical protein
MPQTPEVRLCGRHAANDEPAGAILRPRGPGVPVLGHGDRCPCVDNPHAHVEELLRRLDPDLGSDA